MAAKLKETFENGTQFIGLRKRTSEFKLRTQRRRKWSLPDVGVQFLLLIVLAASCHGYQEQRFAMEPQDQSAIVGERVTLPCRVANREGTVQWTKDGFGLGTHRNLSGYDRYAMIGSDEEGDFSLDIKDVTLEDDGVYQCQVSSALKNDAAPPIRSRDAKLTVLIAPDAPRILSGAFIDAVENQTVNIECVSSGGKPAAEITWLDGNQSVIKKPVNNSQELQDDGRYLVRSVLRLTPNKSHHNQTITCQAQNTADRAPRMATVHIEVKYAPKVKVTISSGMNKGKIRENSELRVRCDVDANPKAQKYRWYINSNPVVGDYTDEMIIFNVSRKHHNALVRCEVSNSVGTSEADITLKVTYPPKFRTKPQDVATEIGSSVVLSCDVDGQPQPELKWLSEVKPGQIELRVRAPNLKLHVTKSTAGRYICKANVDGYPEIEAEATVFIKSAPKILSNRTQFGMEGEYVTLECAALSVPKPDDIRWYFENREISIIQDPDYATLEERLPNGIIKSSLVIRSSQSKHYGQYNCSVTNEYGNANVAIMLKPLKTLPLYIILIGVASGIVLFSGFIILVVVCHRRRRQKSRMNEKPDVTVTTGDMYKESDRSSNISDLKPHLPHSDGSYELEYTSSDRSDSKLHGGGLPLAGPVHLPNIRHDDPLMQFRYSNDYSDPTYSDTYYKNPAGYVYDYPQGYAPPPHLRVQSPGLEVPPPRSLQGSLTRSIDTASTLPLSAGNGSQNNTLQRTTKSPDETDAINNLGLPVGGDAAPQAPIYAQPNPKPQPNVDLRYAATYGNPYLRNSNVGYGSQVHTAKPASTPAPPPYSAVRSSVVIPSGNGQAQATHV